MISAKMRPVGDNMLPKTNFSYMKLKPKSKGRLQPGFMSCYIDNGNKQTNKNRGTLS